MAGPGKRRGPLAGALRAAKRPRCVCDLCCVAPATGSGGGGGRGGAHLCWARDCLMLRVAGATDCLSRGLLLGRLFSARESAS